MQHEAVHSVPELDEMVRVHRIESLRRVVRLSSLLPQQPAKEIQIPISRDFFSHVGNGADPGFRLMYVALVITVALTVLAA